MADISEERKCLIDLCETIEATGGVRIDRKGNYAPVADEDWIDLGDVYIETCKTIGRVPMIEDRED